MGLKYLHLLIKFQSYVMWELVPLWELVPFQTEDPGPGGCTRGLTCKMVNLNWWSNQHPQSTPRLGYIRHYIGYRGTLSPLDGNRLWEFWPIIVKRIVNDQFKTRHWRAQVFVQCSRSLVFPQVLDKGMKRTLVQWPLQFSTDSRLCCSTDS